MEVRLAPAGPDLRERLLILAPRCARSSSTPAPGAVGSPRARSPRCPTSFAARLPGVRRIVLSVNVRNPVAIRTYQRAGFADSAHPPELYLGGAAGPQHVFELRL